LTTCAYAHASGDSGRSIAQRMNAQRATAVDIKDSQEVELATTFTGVFKGVVTVHVIFPRPPGSLDVRPDPGRERVDENRQTKDCPNVG